MEKINNIPKRNDDSHEAVKLREGVMDRRKFVKLATASAIGALGLHEPPLSRHDVQAMPISKQPTASGELYADPYWVEAEVPSDEMMAYVSSLCEDPYENIPWLKEGGIEAYSERSYMYKDHAEEAGLTTFEMNEVYSAIEYAQSTDELLKAFEVLTRQFGAEVSLAENWRFPKITAEDREKRFKGLSDLEILNNRFKGIANQLSVVPLEVFELSGMKQVHFTEILPTIASTRGKQPITAGSAYLDGSGKINISLDQVYYGGANADTFIHETGHLIDYTISGSREAAFRDPVFSAINRPGFEYVADLRFQAEGSGLIKPYSGRNPVEDKAVVLENILSGLRYAIANSNDLIVRKKYRLLLARLEQRIPNIVPYLAAIGR